MFTNIYNVITFPFPIISIHLAQQSQKPTASKPLQRGQLQSPTPEEHQLTQLVEHTYKATFIWPNSELTQHTKNLLHTCSLEL